jgi:hypothetical protein
MSFSRCCIFLSAIFIASLLACQLIIDGNGCQGAAPSPTPATLHAAVRIVNQSVARLQQATGAASTVMLKLMTDPNVPAAVRLRAAECVFDRAFKGVELEDIEERVSELERAAESAEKPR